MSEKTASIIKIDGVEMPTPSSFKPLYKDYDSKNSGRSESMYATRDIVRSDVRKMSFTWIVQTPDLRKIREAIKPPKIQVRFFDINQPADVQFSTMECYADPSGGAPLGAFRPGKELVELHHVIHGVLICTMFQIPIGSL